MQLSDRMAMVAEMVSEGNKAADIGTDHGYVPIYLVENKISPSAVAMDVRKGPLIHANRHIKEHNLENYIKTRLSDGVLELKKDEADSVVIAGMGGGLVVKILTQGREKLANVTELILQPQSDFAAVRRCVCESRYKIIEERSIIEEGKFYFAMKAVKCAEGENLSLSEVEYRYGPFLLKNKDAVMREFLENERRKFENICSQIRTENTQNALRRLPFITKELEYAVEALEEWII